MIFFGCDIECICIGVGCIVNLYLCVFVVLFEWILNEGDKFFVLCFRDCYRFGIGVFFCFCKVDV